MENRKLFLGKWCLASEINCSKLGNYQIAKYHWDDSEKLTKIISTFTIFTTKF